jgi:hypothetical protein
LGLRLLLQSLAQPLLRLLSDAPSLTGLLFGRQGQPLALLGGLPKALKLQPRLVRSGFIRLPVALQRGKLLASQLKYLLSLGRSLLVVV